MPITKTDKPNPVPLEVMQALARLAKKTWDAKGYTSQYQLGDFLGVPQTTASRLLATIEGPRSGRRQRRTIILPGYESLKIIAAKYGFQPGQLLDGTILAQADQVDPMHPNRSAALFFMSDEVHTEILDALRKLPAPEKSARWTRGRWYRWLQDQAKDLEPQTLDRLTTRSK